MRASVRRLLGRTVRASFCGLSERLIMKTVQMKGMPGCIDLFGGGPVKVTVTPKSGTEEFLCCRVVMSTDGRASGRVMAREDTVGTVSNDELPMESWAGR